MTSSHHKVDSPGLRRKKNIKTWSHLGQLAIGDKKGEEKERKKKKYGK